MASSSTTVSASVEVPNEFLAPVEAASEEGAEEIRFIGPLQAPINVEADPDEGTQELAFIGPLQGPVNSQVISESNLNECKTRLSLEGFRLRRLLVDASWRQVLDSEMDKPYFSTLCDIIEADNRVFCPPKCEIFRAFNSTPFPSVKVVLLGQKEPYAYRGRATGIGYSVPLKVKAWKFPSELDNIFSEVVDDVGGTFPEKGSLEKWALQGVLMLPLLSLTVIEKRLNSHSDLGWEPFLDSVIRSISDLKSNVVFMLWGKAAEKKIRLIDAGKHLILKAPSPSPLSVDKGFFGCRHFSLCNEYLRRNGIYPIDWQI